MKLMLRVFAHFLLFNMAIPICHAIYPIPLISQQGMVVSEQHLASEVGAAILQQGGNAVDAAVAVGYALAVTQPCCGNIGGGGFMLIHLADGKNIFLNFREKAPLRAFANMYLDKNGNPVIAASLHGYGAVAVPGTVLGLDFALKKYGSLSRAKVMAPAIKLAIEGFIIRPTDLLRLDKISDSVPTNVAEIFFKNGKRLQAGQRLVQSNLGNTLTQIAEKGPDVFYKGWIASEIVKASETGGGFLSMKDFAEYSVQELAPLQCSYRSYNIVTAPPPSSGGIVLCEILAILEAYDLKTLGFHSAQGVHYIVEAMRFAFADRNNKLGDPDFIKNPINELLSKTYIDSLRSQIQNYRAGVSSEMPYKTQELESTETTHYSIADKQGNLTSVTYTLNGLYGAGVIAGQTGFFLNNQMNDFSVKKGAANQFGLVQGTANNIQPGKRPLSSMTPTVVFHANQPLLVLGSPGGPRIITAVLQTLINVIDYEMDIKAAVDAPRFHHQWLPDYLDMEKFTFSQDTLEKLAYMGYRFRTMKPWSVVEAILIKGEPRTFYGASDDREPAGSAAAPVEVRK